MKSLSRVGLGLSVVFGCLFFALVCEIYYLLWWKRRRTGRRLQDDYYTNTGGDCFYLSSWRRKKKKKSKTRPSTLRSTNLNHQEHNHGLQSEDGFHFQANNGLFPKPFDENVVETGLMVGPPRFLFTITEETKEDLESENGKSKGESRRLSDLIRNGDTPYVTPLSSPAFFTPPVTPSVGSSHSRSSSNGYNPFYESSTDVEFSKMVRSPSPPPMFKFLRDAEEKLQKKNTNTMATSISKKDIVVRQQRQVLPLASSPLSVGSSYSEPSLALSTCMTQSSF